MKEIDNVNTRLKYSAYPMHRDLVSSIVINELQTLLEIEDEVWMKHKIMKYMHQALTNIDKRIPMKLYDQCTILESTGFNNRLHYKAMWRPYPFLSLLCEEYEDGAIMKEDGGTIALEH